MVLLRHAFLSLWDSSMSVRAALVPLFSLLCEVTMCEYATVIIPFWCWLFRLFLIFCYKQCHHRPSCAYPQDTYVGKGVLGIEKPIFSCTRLLPNCSPQPSLHWSCGPWAFSLLGESQTLPPSCPEWLWLQCSHTPLFPVPNDYLIFLRTQLWIWKVYYILSCISVFFKDEF